MCQTSVELPKYKCFKEVHAAKITRIEPMVHGAKLHFGEISNYKEVTDVWMDRNTQSEVGGYFVVYKDGYTSYSPADAFENGYTKV